MTSEKRRYFRIDDTLGLAFRVVTPRVPDLKLSTDGLDDSELLDVLDVELDSLINVFWSSDPKFARAFTLLNQKVDILMGNYRPSEGEILEQFDHYYAEIDVNLSASGIAFGTEARLDINDRLELLLLLKSAKSKLIVMGNVINIEERESEGKPVYYTCVDFDVEPQQEEKLIQYIVQRQVESIGKQKQRAG
jgi:hypothetical protein